MASECAMDERCGAARHTHMLIICKHVFNVSASVVLAIFVRRICLLYSIVASFSHRHWRRRHCLVATLLLLLLIFPRFSHQIKYFELCHVISVEECNFLKFLPWEMLLIYIVFFSIHISTIVRSAIHSLLHAFNSTRRCNTNRQIS